MTPGDPVPQRIGFAERDSAVEALQEHHSLGRLDTAEFEDRMTKALEATTAADLRVLFRDLPAPHPPVLGQPQGGGSAVPATSGLYGASATPAVVDDAHHDFTPWYAQWWMILVAVGITAFSQGRVGFIIPMMAIWLWVIYPSISSNKKPRPPALDRSAEASALAPWQRTRVEAELMAGRKIPAIKLYREYTGAGLKDAKEIVESMQRQIGR